MTIYIVDLEAVDTRYTKEWKTHLPEQLKRHTNKEVVNISGGDTPQKTTPGAFLNFGGTNVYKSNQLAKIGEMFCEGKIKDGDYFLYTDAWNPTVIQLKYMAELLGVKIKIGGMWHAGSYDPADFLGRLIGKKPWVRLAEESMYETFDHNFFATQFHTDMFSDTFIKVVTRKLEAQMNQKIKRVGWPMEYMERNLAQYKNMPKKKQILFPHRLAPEKQLDIFQDLKDSIGSEYDFIICQEQTLSKVEYHNLLGESKLIFSANLQETLGISWYEGTLLDVIPMVPNRLSYKEMAIEEFAYPSEWTIDMEHYRKHKQEVIDKIHDYMENYSKYIPLIWKQREILKNQFFSGKALYEVVKYG